jgi:propanol-preferring alcohol dehydrogenase
VIGLGGVGLHAAQMARATGARVVGFEVHAPSLEAAAAMGILAMRADVVGDEADARGDGFDVVVDTVGHEETFAQAGRLVRTGGRIVGVGYGPTTPFAIPSLRLVLGEIEVVGSRYAHRDDMERAVAMVAAGLVRPVVGMVRPLEGVNEVFDALRAGEIVGRAVLDVAGVGDRSGG